MIATENIIQQPLSELVKDCPPVLDFLSAYRLEVANESFAALAASLSAEFWNEFETNADELAGQFVDFVEGMQDAASVQQIHSLEVIGGQNKLGEPEACNLLIKPGEITCIVGPTGSGKSRLLADIEWLADFDTPTKRRVLLNGELPDENLKSSFGGKLIAQITQNMNFVLDMDVQSFLLLHAQSRFLANADEKVAEVIDLANQLSGETFDPTTPVTFLSGGQSRALMIADVACIGQAPIVLIDEIENAGVDKRKALEVLVSQEKIVLMATHDPLLILQADRRVVIKNGGMHKIIQTNEHEKAYYDELFEIDRKMQQARNFFRLGNEYHGAF
ncbi:ATP-binding cassette domain-containing protein [Mangrovibacterium lignilyticum]|uniref:ATP-binding cassette domain-containing protein n=1 Tax=Mangrovibacterium lignilyticum TaxID=2668052 RepID=UPI0013D772AC|nr:ATP-binding cassette domain-containing protein [Mangrovibacterium lignilyticum]